MKSAINSNAGNWNVSNTSYKFNYKHIEFVLIEANNNSSNRLNHDFENYNYNFLTKKQGVTKGNDKANQKPSNKSNKFEMNESKTLKKFKRPYNWEVTEGFFYASNKSGELLQVIKKVKH